MIRHLQASEPAGVFLTGDVSNGSHVEPNVSKLARNLKCPIYFVLGNHDYHFRTIDSVHDDMRRLMRSHSNLNWMTEKGVVSLNEEVAIIGTEGWYDARRGDHTWLKWTFDRMFTYDFRDLSCHKDRVVLYRKMANESAEHVAVNLEKAFETHTTVYVLTHFPPWFEATYDKSSWFVKYHLPYNTNTAMGIAIENVMKKNPDKNVIVLAGHTHANCWVRVSENIECRVNSAEYYGGPNSEEHIVI